MTGQAGEGGRFAHSRLIGDDNSFGNTQVFLAKQAVICIQAREQGIVCPLCVLPHQQVALSFSHHPKCVFVNTLINSFRFLSRVLYLKL